MTTLDMRVPLRFAEPAALTGGQVAFVEGEHFLATDTHPAGCTCCAARNPAGRALAGLLQDRARGKVGFFNAVAVVARTPAGRAMVLEALRTDPVASACFRLAAED